MQLTQLCIDLLASGTEEAQERAAQALWALVAENPTAHQVIAKAGAPQKLVQLLTSGILSAKKYALWSLSLSITWRSQWSYDEAGARCFNGLVRKTGYRPAAPGRWPARNRAKSLAFRAWRRVFGSPN